MKKQLLIQSLCAALLAVTVEACAPAATAAPTAAPRIPLKVGFLNYASNAPVYFALKEGLFAAQGLDVELVNITSSNQSYPALGTGQIDVALNTMTAAAFNSIAEGLHIKLVADKGFLDPGNSCTTDAWVASKQALAAGLSGPSSLKGRKAVVVRGSMSEYTLSLMLAKGGLTPDDVEYEQINDNAAKVEALRTGAIDLAALGEPWITYAVRENAGEVWVRYSDVLPGRSAAYVAYGPNLLEKNREAGIRFMTAYLQGIAAFNEGKTDRNVKMIADYTRLSPDDVRAACWNTYRPDGMVDTAGLLAYQQWLLQKGLVDKPLALDKFWTDEFVNEAAKRLGR